MNCPSSIDLSRALSDGADPQLEAHLAACPTCTEEWRATNEMLALTREVLSAPRPSASHREDVRSAMLAAHRTSTLGESPPSRPRVERRMLFGAATALAASFAVYLAVRPRSAGEGHMHGTINGLAGAQYLTASSTPDERIMLYEGSIDVQVSPLHRGERFRIILGDAEVEVHGTRFIATAEHGSLVGVVVDHGIVEVRPREGTTRLLHAGEAWRPVAPVIVPPPPPAPAPPPAPVEPPPVIAPPRPAKIAVRPAPAPVEAAAPVDTMSPQERAYGEGWAAMRTGKFEDAATAFRQMLLLDPTGPLAEDATYWSAVALARSKQTPRAITAFHDFLDQYPHSRRLGEASTMLGWILVKQGERTEAEKLFRAALDSGDTDSTVLTSARAGLDALKR